MRRTTEYSLWIGNAGDLWDARMVHANGIEAIVEVADNEPFASLSRELIRLRFPLSDDGENSAWLLRLAAESVATLLRAKVPTLVCCSAGLSRSICVAAAGICLVENRPISESINKVVGAGPAEVSANLFQQFQSVLLINQAGSN